VNFAARGCHNYWHFAATSSPFAYFFWYCDFLVARFVGTNRKHAIMPKQYDKLLRENIDKIFIPLIERSLNIRIEKTSDLPGKLERTTEREPDFLKMVENEDEEKFILHLEFQTTNDSKMLARMRTYHALLLEKYKVRIRQVVLYIGQAPLRMRNRAKDWEVMQGFDLLDITKQDFRTFLNSNVLEEVILAIAADFSEKRSEEAIRMILQRIFALGANNLSTQRAVIQLIILSNISNLESEVTTQLDNMPLTIDIRKSGLYQEGIAVGKTEGIAEGKAEGVAVGKAENNLEVVQKMLKAGEFSIEQIILISGFSKKEIETIKKDLDK
jgi:predicted transposase/invertase (TIGR01784 family)